ncbi:MAG: ABC transporter ATP-binding protein [Flavobacteriales bacterium]|nr:ABC transporter ATP-binding protein [Flavobacteriales bacterium]
MEEVIVVENLSKRYRLGVVGGGTLRDDAEYLWKKITGRLREEDNSEKYHDALKDVSFTVRKGEVVGLIGKNGAGKSTLLKILSKVTAPTAGRVKIKGRLASLLEVGTGFHPELTGLENIYLNGAILGMSRREIRRKLDEIIEFAGVEKYIHTPVKRYSSGMYVRLAFAVAAHLEPDILVVDEVLAVGDIEFQKKCLGKMGEVSQKEGRTIIFVSHNMQAIKRLCRRAILLEKGKILMDGDAAETIQKYLHAFFDQKANDSIVTQIDPQSIVIDDGTIKIIKIVLQNELGHPTSSFYFNEKINIILHVEVQNPIRDVVLIFYVSDAEGMPVGMASSDSVGIKFNFTSSKECISVTLENNFLENNYFLTLMFVRDRDGNAYFWAENVARFQVENLSKNPSQEYYLPWTKYGNSLINIHKIDQYADCTCG